MASGPDRLTILFEADPHLRSFRLRRGKLEALPESSTLPGLSARLSARTFGRGLRARLAAGLGLGARRLRTLQAAPRTKAFARDVAERGRLWLSLSQGEEAARDLGFAAGVSPKDGSLLLDLALAQLCRPDPQAACDAAEKLLRLGYDDAWAHALRGEARRLEGDAAGALRSFERAAALAGADADIHALRGNIDPESLDDALRLHPEHFWARVLRALHRFERRELDGALEDIDAVLRSDDEAYWAHVLRGQMLAARGRRARSEAAYRAGILLHSTAVWAYSRRTQARGYPPMITREALGFSEIARELKSLREQIKTGDRAYEAQILEAEILEDKGDTLLERVRSQRGSPAWATASVARARAFDSIDPGVLAALSEAIAGEKRCGWAYAWRGLMRGRVGETPGALADFDRAEALAPLYDRTYPFRGYALLSAGRFQEAVAAFDQAIEADPDYGPSYRGRCEARRALGDTSALHDLERTFSFWPEQQAAWTPGEPRAWDKTLAGLGSGYARAAWSAAGRLRAGQAADAERALRRVRTSVGEAPWAELFRLEARIRLGAAALPAADVSRAEAGFPAMAWVYALEVEAALRGGHLKRALASLERFLALAPRYAGAQILRARLQRLLGRRGDAAAGLAACLEVHPHDRGAFYEQSLLALEEGEPQAALRSLDRAAREPEQSCWFFQERGRDPYRRALEEAASGAAPADRRAWRAALLLHLGSIAEARSELSQGPAPRSPLHRLLNAALYIKEGRPVEALAALEALGPSAAVLRGVAEMVQGHWSRALRCFDRAAAQDPASFGARILRAQANEALGRWDKVLGDLDAAAQQGGRVPWLELWRAKARIESSRVEEGRRQLDRLLVLEPSMADAHYWVGEAHRRAGDRARSLAAYAEAFRRKQSGEWNYFLSRALVHRLEGNRIDGDRDARAARRCEPALLAGVADEPQAWARVLSRRAPFAVPVDPVVLAL